MTIPSPGKNQGFSLLILNHIYHDNTDTVCAWIFPTLSETNRYISPLKNGAWEDFQRPKHRFLPQLARTKQRSSNVKMFCHEALPEPFSWMKDERAFRLDEGYTKGYDIYDV